jgi:RNA polymerase sigma-70 factor (ECF subfamily)
VDTVRIELNADKTFAWALNRTFSREEAEELSQEILFRALKSLPELHDESKFDAWFWRLADITLKVFRRSKAKERAYLSYDEVTLPSYNEDFDASFDDTADKLRRYITELSASYRDIIVMHYYDNLTCKAISQKLAIPEGTVTYRLSMARSKLKRRCTTLQETALKPQKLSIHISGEGNYNGEDRPFPWQYINDALSQNILYYAYREPKTVEELSELTGVPAFYIEERIENLIKREAVIQPTKATVQTDFMIFDESTASYSRKMAAPLAESVADEFYDCAVKLTQQTIDAGINTAGRGFDELLCLFSLLALDESVPKYPPSVFVKPKTRYDGSIWEYHGNVVGVEYANSGLAMNKCFDSETPNSYAHYVYQFSSFAEQRMMNTEYIWVINALLRNEILSNEQKEQAAQMVESGYLKRKEDGQIVTTMPVLTTQQYEAFKTSIGEIFGEFLPMYQDKIKAYVSGYVRKFPAQVYDAANRNGYYLFVAMFPIIAAVWQQQGKLHIPNGAICDVLLGHE